MNTLRYTTSMYNVVKTTFPRGPARLLVKWSKISLFVSAVSISSALVPTRPLASARKFRSEVTETIWFQTSLRWCSIRKVSLLMRSKLANLGNIVSIEFVYSCSQHCLCTMSICKFRLYPLLRYEKSQALALSTSWWYINIPSLNSTPQLVLK